MTVRFHLFPFRTQKLSSFVPKIVGWRRPVKIGRCRLLFEQSALSRKGWGAFVFCYRKLSCRGAQCAPAESCVAVKLHGRTMFAPTSDVWLFVGGRRPRRPEQHNGILQQKIRPPTGTDFKPMRVYMYCGGVCPGWHRTYYRCHAK